ncbi:MAG: hypothetical protein K0Q79_2788 [Flavipsychrobacter sp.]|nr:hypothetical protein [Flavipsychrobacter sp.]
MKLGKITTLNHYAAGSAITFSNNRLYLVGDNMSYLLVLDTAFNVLDSINIFYSSQNPLPKPTKPDIEAATFVQHNEKSMLLLIGSGSLDTYRNGGWLLDIASREKTTIDLALFYNRLKTNNIPDLNIEGITQVKNTIILCSRGNKTNPMNYLVYTSTMLWTNPEIAPINVKTIATDTNSGSFSGVSDMDYSGVSDRLILTASTEDTRNSYADGAIGKSYLWLINNASGKKGITQIIPDRIIDLELADDRFKGQKIEAVCILSETIKQLTLVLAADNDNGSTTLFKVQLDLED